MAINYYRTVQSVGVSLMTMHEPHYVSRHVIDAAGKEL